MKTFSVYFNFIKALSVYKHIKKSFHCAQKSISHTKINQHRAMKVFRIIRRERKKCFAHSVLYVRLFWGPRDISSYIMGRFPRRFLAPFIISFKMIQYLRSSTRERGCWMGMIDKWCVLYDCQIVKTNKKKGKRERNCLKNFIASVNINRERGRLRDGKTLFYFSPHFPKI